MHLQHWDPASIMVSFLHIPSCAVILIHVGAEIIEVTSSPEPEFIEITSSPEPECGCIFIPYLVALLTRVFACSSQCPMKTVHASCCLILRQRGN